jgi:hypothetical protein
VSGGEGLGGTSVGPDSETEDAVAAAAAVAMGGCDRDDNVCGTSPSEAAKKVDAEALRVDGSGLPAVSEGVITGVRRSLREAAMPYA